MDLRSVPLAFRAPHRGVSNHKIGLRVTQSTPVDTERILTRGREKRAELAEARLGDVLMSHKVLRERNFATEEHV